MLAVPPPPTLEPLVLESLGNEECGKYLKAVASAREVAGAARGARGAALFPGTVQKGGRWGSWPPEAHPARAEASGAGRVGPGATMALRCIVVEAAEVLQGCLVAELVLVLREGGTGTPSVPLLL